MSPFSRDTHPSETGVDLGGFTGFPETTQNKKQK